MDTEHETIFTMEATPVKFGRGASGEAGWDSRASACAARCSSPIPASPLSGIQSGSRG